MTHGIIDLTHSGPFACAHLTPPAIPATKACNTRYSTTTAATMAKSTNAAVPAKNEL